MSSDGAIDKPRSARPARGEDRGVAGIALAVLLVLALIATIVMVFSDNPVWMRIGTLAALWAAFIGAFLVAKYRRQAAAEAARVRDLHTVYELQLEREISARREHELVVEKDLRDSIRAETSDSVHALRHEIAALREQLGQLGVTLPEDRLAVGGLGSAGELGAGSGLPSVPSERVAPRRRAPERADAGRSDVGRSDAGRADAGRSGTGRADAGRSDFGRSDAGRAAGRADAGAAATGVSRDATPSTERTEKFSPVDATQEPGREQRRQSSRETSSETSREQRRPAVRPVTRPQSVVEDQKSRTTEMPAVTEPVKTEPAKSEPAKAPAAEAPAAKSEPKPADSKAAENVQPAVKSRHGDGGGTSVADLMARLGGGDAPSGRRRRHHSED